MNRMIDNLILIYQPIIRQLEIFLLKKIYQKQEKRQKSLINKILYIIRLNLKVLYKISKNLWKNNHKQNLKILNNKNFKIWMKLIINRNQNILKMIMIFKDFLRIN